MDSKVDRAWRARDAEHPRPAGSRREPPVVDVRDLVGDGKEAVIVHAGERYRLRITSNERLILTK